MSGSTQQNALGREARALECRFRSKTTSVNSVAVTRRTFHSRPTSFHRAASKVSSVIPGEVGSFLNARVGDDPKRGTLDNFLGQTLSWRGVQASVSRSQKSKDGWGYGINVTRQGFGARFMAVFPRAMKVIYRLSEEDIHGIDPVEIRNVRPTNPYRIRASLKGPAGVDACLDLARRAYQRTFEERLGMLTDVEEDEP